MFKIVLLGNKDSGKTELFKNINGPFVEVKKIRMMVGADFYESIYENNNVRANVSIWNISSQPRYLTIYPQMIIRGAKAVAIVYDAANRQCFQGVQRWIEMSRSKEIEQPYGFIVANIRKGSERTVTPQQGKTLSKEWGFIYLQLCAQEKADSRDFIETVVTCIQKPTQLWQIAFYSDNILHLISINRENEVGMEEREAFLQRMGKEYGQIQKMIEEVRSSRGAIVKRKRNMPKLMKKKCRRSEKNMERYGMRKWVKVNYTVNKINSSNPNNKEIKRLGKTHFNCPICFRTVTDSIITVCGHLYCCKCIEEVFNSDRKCSYCQTPLNHNLVKRSQITQEIICQLFLSALSLNDNVNRQQEGKKWLNLWKNTELNDLTYKLVDFYDSKVQLWRNGIVVKVKPQTYGAGSVVLLELRNLQLIEIDFSPFNFADCLLQQGKINNILDPFAFLAADKKDRILTSKIEKYWQSIEDFKVKRYQLPGPSLYALYLSINLKRKQLIADLCLFRFYKRKTNESVMHDEETASQVNERNPSSYRLLLRLLRLTDLNENEIEFQAEEANDQQDLQILQNQMLELSIRVNDEEPTIEADHMQIQEKQQSDPIVAFELPIKKFDIGSIINQFQYDDDSNLLLSQLIFQ